ncbi:hypothetical protein [Lactiplantibacillus plantarum]|uniref:hypothetical protein n=1 Tax=Lactiplantibacillus plantarum TaxID=1590 RepID=UPI004045CC7A
MVPAIEELLGIARQAVDHAADPALAPTWEAVVEPLDTASERLWRAWSVAGHLNAVVNTPELREAYNQSSRVVAAISSSTARPRPGSPTMTPQASSNSTSALALLWLPSLSFRRRMRTALRGPPGIQRGTKKQLSPSSVPN